MNDLTLPRNTGWLLYADCDVTYDGRASSYLERGNYLIIVKPDNCLAIHGATLIQPRNYLGSNTSWQQTDAGLAFTCKNEEIIIKIYQVLSLTVLDHWSAAKVTICKTEEELAQQIFVDWFAYFPESHVQIIHNEYQTTLGAIDVFGQSPTTDFVIEVKRKRASLKDVSQLRRYMEAVAKPERQIQGYLACPSLSKTAIAYLKKHDLHHLKIDFTTEASASA